MINGALSKKLKEVISENSLKNPKQGIGFTQKHVQEVLKKLKKDYCVSSPNLGNEIINLHRRSSKYIIVSPNPRTFYPKDSKCHRDTLLVYLNGYFPILFQKTENKLFFFILNPFDNHRCQSKKLMKIVKYLKDRFGTDIKIYYLKSPHTQHYPHSELEALSLIEFFLKRGPDGRYVESSPFDFSSDLKLVMTEPGNINPLFIQQYNIQTIKKKALEFLQPIWIKAFLQSCDLDTFSHKNPKIQQYYDQRINSFIEALKSDSNNLSFGELIEWLKNLDIEYFLKFNLNDLKKRYPNHNFDTLSIQFKPKQPFHARKKLKDRQSCFITTKAANRYIINQLISKFKREENSFYTNENDLYIQADTFHAQTNKIISHLNKNDLKETCLPFIYISKDNMISIPFVCIKSENKVRILVLNAFSPENSMQTSHFIESLQKTFKQWSIYFLKDSRLNILSLNHFDALYTLLYGLHAHANQNLFSILENQQKNPKGIFLPYFLMGCIQDKKTLNDHVEYYKTQFSFDEKIIAFFTQLLNGSYISCFINQNILEVYTTFYNEQLLNLFRHSVFESLLTTDQKTTIMENFSIAINRITEDCPNESLESKVKQLSKQFSYKTISGLDQAIESLIINDDVDLSENFSKKVRLT